LELPGHQVVRNQQVRTKAAQDRDQCIITVGEVMQCRSVLFQKIIQYLTEHQIVLNHHNTQRRKVQH